MQYLYNLYATPYKIQMDPVLDSLQNKYIKKTDRHKKKTQTQTKTNTKTKHRHKERKKHRQRHSGQEW